MEIECKHSVKDREEVVIDLDCGYKLIRVKCLYCQQFISKSKMTF